MIHKSPDRYFVVPEGAVMNSGGSLNIAKDQIGLFAMKHVSHDGVQAVSSFAGMNKGAETFEIRLGINGSLSRTNSDKAKSSMPFKLSDVKKAWVGKPTISEQTFDELYIGYDGFDANRSFSFKPGDYFTIQLNLWGKVLGMLNPTDADYYTVEHLIDLQDVALWDSCEEGDPCEPIDCREKTLDAVRAFNNHMIPSGLKLSQFLTIKPVFECATPSDPTPVNYSLWQLSFCGSGNNIGGIQAQYPGVEVFWNSMAEAYQMLVPTNTSGEEGSDAPPAAYVQTVGNVVPNCGECPESYSLVEGGFVYLIKYFDETVDESAIIEALFANAVADSTAKIGFDEQYGYYTIILTEAVDGTDMSALLGVDASATILFVGMSDGTCVNGSTVSLEWTKVATATAINETYEIVLPDHCGTDITDQLQAYYPELVITLVTDPAQSQSLGGGANCLNKYTTQVMSDLQFPDGCVGENIVKNVYTTEAPEPYDINAYWVKVAGSDAGTECKCGIYVKGKPVVMNAKGDCMIDELPFIATSMRVKAAGGYQLDHYLNTRTWKKPIAIRQVSYAKDLDNLGGNLRSFERQGNYYFVNESYYKNAYSRELTGTQNVLQGLRQYNFYGLQVDGYKQAQSLGGYALDAVNYLMVVPTDVATDVENLHTLIATGAGVPVEG